SPQSQFALASFELAAGKPAAAEAIDQKLAREAPSFLAAREQWAQIAGQNQDYAQMNRVLDALLKDRPNDLNALLLRAGAQLNQRQPGPALETLAAAQRLRDRGGLPATEQLRSRAGQLHPGDRPRPAVYRGPGGIGGVDAGSGKLPCRPGVCGPSAGAGAAAAGRLFVRGQ